MASKDDDVSSVSSGSDSEAEVKMDLSNPDVVTKYKQAGDIASRVMKKVISLCSAGACIGDICEAGDQEILAETKTVYNKKVKGKLLDKGIAFPTCISVNNIICHFSPLKSDPETKLAEGDVVKIDLGAHLDGYIGVCAHTLVIGATKDKPVTGRQADVILAAHYATEVAIRMVANGGKSQDVTAAIQKVSEDFKCSPVEGMMSHQLLRNTIDGEKAIIQNPNETHRKDHKESKFETNEVYAVDVIMSTGTGKPKQSDIRTTVYKKTDTTYLLKMKASRAFFSEVKSNFTSMPFSLRSLKDERSARMGVKECSEHNVVEPFHVLHEEKDETVAQFKVTVLLMANGNMRSTSSTIDLDTIKSDYAVIDPEMKKLLLSSVTTKAKKKNKKKKKPAKAAASTD